MPYTTKYYNEHREEIAEYKKRYQEIHSKKIADYQKQYKIEHLEEIAEYQKQWYTSRRENLLKRQGQQRNSRADEVEKILPNVCYFSGYNCRHYEEHKRLILHEKSGARHEKSATHIIYENPARAKDFVRLCYRHHRLVHSLMDFYLTWDEIANFLDSKRNGSEKGEVECGRVRD